MPEFRTALLLALPLSAGALALPAAAAPAVQAAAAQPSVKDGVDAWKSGDYQRAVAVWRPLAIAGDPDAQFNLGQAYKLGRGVPTDLVQAEAWYRRAADQGYLQAEDNLGLVLFTANRRAEAMPYIMRSAARGEPRAQYVLGTAHFNGDLAPRDWPRAYALTKRASDAGLPLASARLAQLDGLIPFDQRQAGLAMLPEIEKAEARARLAAVNAAAPPTPPPAPSPVKTASLPASVPGTRYTPPPVIKSMPPAAVSGTPAANAAATAAAEAVAAANAAPVRAVPQPIASAEVPPSTPAPTSVEPGTSYAAPPESRDVPRAATPATPPQPTPPPPAPAKAAPPEPQPAAPAATPAPVPAATADAWRAQLGAFAQDGNARNLWTALEKKYPALTANQPYLVKSGKLTRLQAGNFASKADADKFCAAVGSASQPCVVMRNK